MDENTIGTSVVDAAIAVHRALGPGLLESVYEVTLAEELRSRGLEVERQVAVPLVYRGRRFEEGFRVDLLVHSKVIVEIKSLWYINAVHRKQLLTYLRLTDNRLGYLLNFGQPLMRSGVFRIVNSLYEAT